MPVKIKTEPTQRNLAVHASQDQVALLSAAFALNNNPNAARLKEISRQTGLSERWLSSWFTRRRSKLRKQISRAQVTKSKDLVAMTSSWQVKKEILTVDDISQPTTSKLPLRKQGTSYSAKAAVGSRPDASQLSEEHSLLPPSSPPAMSSSLPSSPTPQTPPDTQAHIPTHIPISEPGVSVAELLDRGRKLQLSEDTLNFILNGCSQLRQAKMEVQDDILPTSLPSAGYVDSSIYDRHDIAVRARPIQHKKRLAGSTRPEYCIPSDRKPPVNTDQNRMLDNRCWPLWTSSVSTQGSTQASYLPPPVLCSLSPEEPLRNGDTSYMRPPIIPRNVLSNLGHQNSSPAVYDTLPPAPPAEFDRDAVVLPRSLGGHVSGPDPIISLDALCLDATGPPTFVIGSADMPTNLKDIDTESGMQNASYLSWGNTNTITGRPPDDPSKHEGHRYWVIDAAYTKMDIDVSRINLEDRGMSHAPLLNAGGHTSGFLASNSWRGHRCHPTEVDPPSISASIISPALLSLPCCDISELEYTEDLEALVMVSYDHPLNIARCATQSTTYSHQNQSLGGAVGEYNNTSKLTSKTDIINQTNVLNPLLLPVSVDKVLSELEKEDDMLAIAILLLALRRLQ